MTSDGWRNHNRRQYHNFILVAASGPIYLGLKDVSGESGNAQAIHDEFVHLFATLDNDIVQRIIIGCTDTPSANAIPLSKFKAMGGQAGMWSQARRQYQFPTNKSNIPSSRLVVVMKSFMALCGWHIIRAMFCIVGGSHQFMHRDRGHYHSISLFVCLVARRVRFGRRGGEDFEVFMNAGDVLAFNGLVWYSGFANDSDSCVVFMYFDREPFYITDEMRADETADQSRFGFTKMYNEEQWVEYSATHTADQDTYTAVQLENMEMLPTSLLRALVPASEFTKNFF